MATFLYHAHVCPGVQPGFFITDYIQQNYPLGENESYTYIASNIYCKDDSLTYLLDLSPGLGNFFVQKLPKNETENGLSQGVLVVWDDNLKIGKAMIVNFQNGKIDTSKYATSEAQRANTIKGFIDLYSGRANSDIKSTPVVTTVSEKWITEEQFNMLKQGAGENFNSISYLKSLENVTKEDLLNAMNQNSNSNSNSNNSNTNATSNTNSNSNSNSNSNVPDSGAKPSGSASVGTTGAIISSVSSQSPTQGESEDSQNGKDNAKAYEVSKSPAAKSIDSNSLLYALIGVLAIGILLGVGYVKRSKK